MATLAIAALATACVDRAAVERTSAQDTLVLLTGTAVTMLAHHDISVDEAQMLRTQLNAAKREIAAGNDTAAMIELDSVRQYLKSRQGQPL